MRNVGNWVGELTTTAGTGPITLGGALGDQFTRFSDVGITSVEYAIVDGNNREAGIGTINAGVLTRDVVQSTIVNGNYSGNSPGPITLSGLAEVYSTFNRVAYDEMKAYGDRITNLEGQPAGTQIALEVPVTPNAGVVSTDVQNALEELSTEILNITLGQESVVQIITVNAITVNAIEAHGAAIVVSESAVATDYVIRPDSTLDFPIGTVLTLRQKGVGQITIVAGSGVTIEVEASKGLLIKEQFGWASIVKEAANYWSIAGSLTA